MYAAPRKFAVVALAVLLGGCTLPQGVGEERQIVRGYEDPNATFALQPVTRDTVAMLANWPNSHPTPNLGWIKRSATSPDPLIQAGDTLDLAVWDNDDSSLLSSAGQKVIQLPNLKVSSKGTVFLPYADEVYVAKMTPDQARKAIQDKLLSIVPTAQVQLSYVSGSGNSVDLISGMPNPGKVPLTDRNTSLTSVLAQAGGIPSNMVNPQINLSRGGKLYRVSAATLLANPELDTTMRGGDKVFIEEDKRYFLSLGAAGKQALINFTSDRVTALDALSLIGGLSENTADPRGILILRDYPASAVRTDSSGPSRDRMVFSLDLTHADGLFSAGQFGIQDRDLVLVTQSTLVNTNNIFSLVGSAFRLVNTTDSMVNKLSK